MKTADGFPIWSSPCSYNVKVGQSSQAILDKYKSRFAGNYQKYCWGGNTAKGSVLQPFYCSTNGQRCEDVTIYQLNDKV